jgi:signal transduction histidine kinase
MQRPFDLEFRLRRADGAFRHVRLRSAPYAGPDGAVAGHVASCADVHDLHAADAAKSSFLSLVAHELRTPLTSILAYFEVLRRSTDREKLLTTSLVDRLTAQMNRFSSLVDELADAARWNDRQSLDLTSEAIDLRDLVGETVELFADSARLDGFKPRHFFWFSALGSYHVRGDRRRLAQMVWHLLDNAVKFSPAGGRISVELEGDDDGATHRIRVSDEGIGVPPNDVACLGRAYFRASNASAEQYPGIGLGLAITREIAERHGGRMTVDSRLGLGTNVTVTLPGATAAAPPESQERGAA